MDERMLQFRIGVVVVAAIIIAGLLIMLFGQMPSVWSDDYAADKADLAQRYEVAMDMGVNSNICYFDTAAETGTMLELIERNDTIVGMFGRIRQAAADWDGTRPLRAVSELF